MATTTLSVHKRALHSLVIKKVLMACTGLVLILFLLMHMFGNLKMFISAEAYNHYAHWLQGSLPGSEGGILEPILPHGWFIWIFRAFMLACLVIHIYCAIKVWTAAIHARGSYTKTKRPSRTLSARLMRWGGITLALLLIFHLLMFTTKTVRPGGWGASAEPYDMFLASFQQPVIFVIYFVFMVVVCMHVRHGFYSAFTTLGANVSPRARDLLNVLAYFVAALVFTGFILPPLAVLIGFIPGGM